jgi:hypothetical protein
VRYFGEYFEGLGFTPTATEEDFEGRNSSRLTYQLTKANPTVPASLARIELRVISTGVGCLVLWDRPVRDGPEGATAGERRFVSELLMQMERVVSTGSRGTAKVMRENPGPFLPGP